MINNPQVSYSGLTIVVDDKSRFDTTQLISGTAGSYFDNCLLTEPQYGVFRANCEIRTLAECKTLPFRPYTTALLLLGEESLKWAKPGVTLGEQRGSPFMMDSKVCVASYIPQDAFDRRDYFKDEEGDDDEDSAEEDVKSTHGKTRRKNWKFWLREDVKKAVRLCKNGLVIDEPTIHLWPTADSVVELLGSVRNGTVYFDIETDALLQMTCFGFSFNGKDVYVVPMLQTYLNPRQYYYDDTDTARILRALCVCLCGNNVVIHNSSFDLFVLIWRYHLPIHARVFDTMLVTSRLYADIEKSLGHCVSLYTDLPYHKNEGVFEPRTLADTETLYRYNAKDVHAMSLIKRGMEEKAVKLKAVDSINQVNSMVMPYLVATLQGMAVDWSKLDAMVTANDRKKFQISRMLSILTGKPDFNPNSHQQVGKYLYDEIGFERPKKDPTNEKTLLSLLLYRDVAVIHCVLEYRGLTKQSGKLKFLHWGGLYHSGYDVATGVSDVKAGFTTSWKLAGASTMRLSSSKVMSRTGKKPRTYFGGWGDNAQNFEKELRKVIVPADYVS